MHNGHNENPWGMGDLPRDLVQERAMLVGRRANMGMGEYISPEGLAEYISPEGMAGISTTNLIFWGLVLYGAYKLFTGLK